MQKGVGLEGMDEQVSPYCTAKYLAKLLNCWNNAITRWLKELGYENMWSPCIHHNLPPNHDCERLQTLA